LSAAPPAARQGADGGGLAFVWRPPASRLAYSRNDCCCGSVSFAKRRRGPLLPFCAAVSTGIRTVAKAVSTSGR